MAGSSKSSGCLVWIVIIAVIIIAPTVLGDNDSGGSSGSNTGSATQTTQTNNATQNTYTPTDPDANLTPKTLPQNGKVLNGSEGGYAGVKVTASYGENAYVKVKDAQGKTVVGFFVRAGSTAQVYVPEGTYTVQFAMGDTWYGKKKCFGSKTAYGQDEGVSLGYGDLITYTLQKTTSGNFSMQSLDESQF